VVNQYQSLQNEHLTPKQGVGEHQEKMKQSGWRGASLQSGISRDVPHKQGFAEIDAEKVGLDELVGRASFKSSSESRTITSD